jgi:parallel beta-helix repeat protein
VLVGNEAFGSTGPPEGTILDGIFIGAFTAGTVLRDNYAHDNDDDGFDIRGVDTRLEDNRADDNGDFGIDAVAGVTDLGGNTATGNGNPLQCRNVFCP